VLWEWEKLEHFFELVRLYEFICVASVSGLSLSGRLSQVEKSQGLWGPQGWMESIYS